MLPFPILVTVTSGIAAITIAGALVLSQRGRPGLAVGLAFAGAMALVLFYSLAYVRLVFDDAFITFRYSRHLADGLGPNWNSSGRVEGYTNFLWMAVLAGLARLGADIVVTAQVLGALSVLATFLCLFAIWRLWSADEPETGVGHPAVFAIVLVGLGLVDGMGFWGLSGLETPGFMALVTGAALLYFRERRSGGLPWSAVALAAASMTRPEGLIATTVTGAFVVAGVLQAPDRQRELARALLWGGLFVALYGSYFIWRYSYYGYLFPNTYYAKVDPTVDLYNRGLGYIRHFGLQYHVLPALAGAAVLATRQRIGRDALYVAALSTAFIAAMVYEGGDAFAHGRFFLPILPLLFLAGVCGFAVLARRLTLPAPQTAALAASVLILAALSLLPPLRDGGLRPSRNLDAATKLLAGWFNQHLPEDYTVASPGVGVVGYYIHRDILDLLGINDVVIAHTDVEDLGAGIAGHERSNPDYVFEVARPEIMLIATTERRQLSDEEVMRRLNALADGDPRAPVFKDPRLWELYGVRSVEIEGLWFHFAQRKDTIADLQAPGLF